MGPLDSAAAPAGAPHPPRWSRQRWAGAVAAALGLQLGLVWLLGERSQPKWQPPDFGLQISLVTEFGAGTGLAQLPLWTDPTLFALPNLGGFSGRGWMSAAPLEYEPEPWTEPWRWLAPELGGLGQGSAALLAASARAPLLVADKPLPRLIGADRPVVAVPVRTQSVVRLRGPLAQRAWAEPVSAPSWPHPDLLSNTVVQACVDAAGWVVSAAVLQSSGSAQADEFALRQVVRARFQPVETSAAAEPGPGCTQGQVEFLWHTVPPPEGTGPDLAP